MSNNFLLLNNDKTEVIVFGPKRHRASVSLLLESQGLKCSNEARNLGVVLDSDLNFNKHFSNITKSAIFQLRSISKIRSFISFSDAQTVIHAFVTNHLDYCNSLFSGLPQKSINRLQLVQNTAARVLTKTRKYDHITPILASLHWLPVALRTDFKMLLFVFKSRIGTVPVYISDLLSPYTPTRTLRSSDQLLLEVKTANLVVTEGDRAFAVRAPHLWNNLPLVVRQATSLTTFKTLLKTHFYRMAFN